jgi:hypothetical protein
VQEPCKSAHFARVGRARLARSGRAVGKTYQRRGLGDLTVEAARRRRAGRSRASPVDAHVHIPRRRRSAMTDSLTSSADVELAEDYLKQWTLQGTQSGAVLPKSAFGGPKERNYTLKSKQVRKFLQHEHQTYGINLGWTDDAEPDTANEVRRWFIARSGDDSGPIRYGETVALGNGEKPSFIRDAHRTVGVDLDWSDTPVYEWKLLGGPAGTPVGTSEYLAIYNVKAGECLIYFDRTRGGDIGWPSSKTWGQQLEDRLIQLVKDNADDAVKALLAA